MPAREDNAVGLPSPVNGIPLSASEPTPPSTPPAHLLLLAILFAGSGCAALIYELVWFQMLQLVIGSTAVAIAALLASFMGGLCLGSILLPKRIALSLPPLRAWAFLELGIGALGLTVLWVMPGLARLYVAAAPSGLGGMLLRGALCVVSLLPSTLLMGATLPVVARYIGTTRSGASQLGLIYGANTLGAVSGALLAGFCLLRILDIYAATYVAAGLNAVVAFVALNLKGGANHLLLAEPHAPASGKFSMSRSPVYVAIALSGLCALAAEVVWTRLLSLTLGGTTYTFSIILAVFLLGLGIGSGVGSVIARWIQSPRMALGICQCLLAPGIAWAAYMLADSLPYWPVNPSLAQSVWIIFQMDLCRSLCALLPATCLWGATFPLALAAVAVTELNNGVRNFHVSGKIEASTDPQDMRLQRMLGHIPALFHPDPHSALVIGCGAGVTAGSFLTHPGIERVTLCEIEPLIPKVVARYFAEENYDVVQDPRVRLILDDARHYVLTTRDKFDVITSDPVHPWVKGASTLYTREFFELCRRHLTSGGMMTQWVPLYESSFAAVKSEIATFFDVFPEGTLWSNDAGGAGYDLVLLGQTGPLELDVETLQQRLRRADHQKVTQSLRDVSFRSAFSLVGTYGGQARDLKPWLKYAEINRDRDLRLQYLAGMGLNLNQSDAIYTEIMSFRKFPEDIFPGSTVWNDAWRRTFLLPPARTNKPSADPITTGNHAVDSPGW